MRDLLPDRIPKPAAVTLVVLGVAALVVALFGFGDRVIGSVCLDGWFSSSTERGRCSSHGGVASDTQVNTLLGTQPGNWVGLVRWPMLALGLSGSGLGVASLMRRRLDSMNTQDPSVAPEATSSDAAVAEHGGPIELVVGLDAAVSGSFVVQAVSSRGPSARHVLRRPMPVDRGLGDLQQALRRPRIRGFGSKRNRAVEQFGSQLFDLLFAGPIEPLYRQALDQAITDDTRLHVVLRMPEQVAGIPWEYLWDHRRGAYLALSQDTSLTRRVDVVHSTSPRFDHGALRVLLMAASPLDHEPLAVDAEHQRIRTELDDLVGQGSVQVRTVSGASLADLRAALDDFEPHVFHFSGHGSWDEQRDDGVVVFADERGRSQPVTGRQLGVLLNRSRLRVAVFNSCDAGRASTSDRFAGIAGSLVAQGVPAAVGMQFRFDDAAAATFGAAFLERLASTRSVADALLAARLAVFTIPNDIEWATPVLTARVPLDEVLTQPATDHARQR